jgi:hypothetical protein
MNRMAEKVSAVMNDAELEALIQQHYQNEAQTLTKGAEANLLKLKELTNAITPEQAARWEEIKKTFRKNLVLGGNGSNDPVTQVVQRLSACYDGIAAIREVLAAGLASSNSAPSAPPITLIIAPSNGHTPSADGNGAAPSLTSDGIRELKIDQETLLKIWEVIEQQKAAGVPLPSNRGEPHDPISAPRENH